MCERKCQFCSECVIMRNPSLVPWLLLLTNLLIDEYKHLYIFSNTDIQLLSQGLFRINSLKQLIVLFVCLFVCLADQLMTCFFGDMPYVVVNLFGSTFSGQMQRCFFRNLLGTGSRCDVVRDFFSDLGQIGNSCSEANGTGIMRH